MPAVPKTVPERGAFQAIGTDVLESRPFQSIENPQFQ